MSDTEHAEGNDVLPEPSACGFEVTFEGSSIVITLRKTFDAENGGMPWAKIIDEAFQIPFENVIVDMHNIKIASSSTYAGLIDIQRRMSGRTTKDIIIRAPSGPVKRGLIMLQINKMFKVEDNSIDTGQG